MRLSPTYRQKLARLAREFGKISAASVVRALIDAKYMEVTGYDVPADQPVANIDGRATAKTDDVVVEV